jgi:aldose 1-epimerase
MKTVASPVPNRASGVAADGVASAGRLALESAALSVELVPATGGGIARFDWKCGTRRVPLFRAAPDGAVTDPDALACYPLLPFSNRIGQGRFEFGGRTVRLEPNRKGERLPLHGSGWQRAWRVERQSAHRAVLSLDEAGEADIGVLVGNSAGKLAGKSGGKTGGSTAGKSAGSPYSYHAVQDIELVDTTLTIRLEIENRGEAALPFGMGLHPFMTRGPDTLLLAPASRVWLSGRDWLPTRSVPTPAAFRFGVAYPLPREVVNHAFTDWSGRARILWPEEGLALDIEADTRDYVLYTPAGKNWFCFEPVDHPINAVNLEGGAVRHGMTVLAPGARLARTFRFTVDLFGALPRLPQR